MNCLKACGREAVTGSLYCANCRPPRREVERINHAIVPMVAETIQSSHNLVDSADISKELRLELHELISQVGEFGRYVPESQNVAKSLELLVRQATSAPADRRWSEIAAQALIESARPFSPLIEPIAARVSRILQLLS